jgi:cob(I)alamin adenosyltransferase
MKKIVKIFSRAGDKIRAKLIENEKARKRHKQLETFGISGA